MGGVFAVSLWYVRKNVYNDLSEDVVVEPEALAASWKLVHGVLLPIESQPFNKTGTKHKSTGWGFLTGWCLWAGCLQFRCGMCGRTFTTI